MEFSTRQQLRLHKDMLSIPFLNKCALSHQFSDVLGLCHIDYAAVSMISPIREIVVLSSRPALEFNLIQSGLWQYDDFFTLSGWQCTEWHPLYEPRYYAVLKQLKEIEYRFTHTLHVRQQVNDSHLIYSFATRQQHNSLTPENLPSLLNIGDYCYRGLAPIFSDVFTTKAAVENLIKIDFSKRIVLSKS